MFFKSILIALLFVITIYAQEQEIEVKFSEPMDRVSLFNVNNWHIYDSNLNEIPIKKIGVAEGDTIAILYTPFLDYKTNFTVRVNNVKDKAGNIVNPIYNSAWFYCDGYDSTQVRPEYIIK